MVDLYVINKHTVSKSPALAVHSGTMLPKHFWNVIRNFRILSCRRLVLSSRPLAWHTIWGIRPSVIQVKRLFLLFSLKEKEFAWKKSSRTASNFLRWNGKIWHILKEMQMRSEYWHISLKDVAKADLSWHIPLWLLSWNIPFHQALQEPNRSLDSSSAKKKVSKK